MGRRSGASCLQLALASITYNNSARGGASVAAHNQTDLGHNICELGFGRLRSQRTTLKPLWVTPYFTSAKNQLAKVANENAVSMHRSEAANHSFRVFRQYIF